MTTPDWTDQALIKAIRGGGAARDAALQHLYLRPGLREAVFRHVLDHGGRREDAQDIFQESLVIFDRNLREGRFEGKSALTTYFVAIAKWRWLTVRRQQGRYTELDPIHFDGEVDSPEQDALRAEQRELLQDALGRIGDRCKQLLTLYQLEYSMKEIAEQMQYESADVAKKEAYRCRLRLRDLLEKSPEWSHLLKSL
jgi:RNA polymerase sigma factor (sigma-70 family)